MRRTSLLASGAALALAVASTLTQAAPLPAAATSSQADSHEAIRVLLVAQGETTLSSAVAARIKDLNASLGMPFSAGQALVAFDCEEPQAHLNMAKAELAGAIETHEAKLRMQGLQQASDVEVALAASGVDKARAQAMLYQSQVRQCVVIAPWAGRIAKLHVRNHMSVTPGQPLLELVKSGPLRLRLNVPSRTLAQVKVGRLFDVTIDETGKSYQARVAAINSRVDPVSQSIELEANMAKAYPELLPGMSGSANPASAGDAH